MVSPVIHLDKDKIFFKKVSLSHGTHDFGLEKPKCSPWELPSFPLCLHAFCWARCRLHATRDHRHVGTERLRGWRILKLLKCLGEPGDR